MNAIHIPRAQPEHQPVSADEPASAFEAERDGLLLCALLDGELSEAELSDWLAREPDLSDVALHGQAHQLIGDVLRGQAALTGGTSACVFLAGVQARLHLEVRAEAVPTESVLPAPAIEVPQVRAPAANDAVFRWKLVAGLASLAAVMAVSWTVLGTTPGGAGPGAGAPQLALSQPSPEGVTSTSATTSLVVNTRQGVLIRDAELEALMAEHRHYGGVSALQMPAGFLRNATFDPDAR
jgi:sigma-E factor negative regulatory protein RseA